MTDKKSTEDQLTLFAVASPVKTSPPQADKAAYQRKGQAYSMKCAELLASVDLNTRSLRVTNLLNGGGGDWFTEVLCEISSLGYDAEWHCIPASGLGAPHERDRLWIVLSDPDQAQWERGGLSSGIRKELVNFSCDHWGQDFPAFQRVANGIPSQMDRLRGLGNAVVPQIPEIIGRAIMGARQ